MIHVCIVLERERDRYLVERESSGHKAEASRRCCSRYLQLSSFKAKGEKVYASSVLFHDEVFLFLQVSVQLLMSEVQVVMRWACGFGCLLFGNGFVG